MILGISMDPKKADGMRFLSFTPNFEILRGAAPKTPPKGLKPFELPDMMPPEGD